jgi:ERCC4-type nuclease
VDQPELTISVTKPRAKPALMLAEKGITILPVAEDEGNVDRYILSQRLAVERRTGGGLLRGIVDKTLFTSAIYLRERFEIPVLIVEGQVNYAYGSFSPQAVRGALSSMMLVYGLNVVSTPNVEETVALITMMARQEQVGIPEISLIPKRKAVDLPDMQRRVVEMLPGCGMSVARDLLQHFGTLNRIANATEAELRRVRGIGAKKAAEMVRVLNAEYEAVDTERQLEDAIEESPELLFDQPVVLLERQHQILTDQGERHVVDMVFWDDDANELFLVELKRGRLTGEHEEQLRRYLALADRSPRLRQFLDKGAQLRGILATVADCAFTPRSPDVIARIVDREQTIQVLKRMREQWFESWDRHGI